MNMTQASAHYFDQVAGKWDELRTGYFTEGIRQAVITKAHLRPEMVVADIGAGTGFISAGLAPLVNKVHLIDGSTAMLAVARQNLAQFQNLEYHRAESQALPLADQSMDAVFANMYLHHCPDPAAAIGEMVRILKPGGRLVITDLDSHTNNWMKEEMADEWLGFERQQIRIWLQSAGLVNTLIDCTGESCCAKSAQPKEEGADQAAASISVFIATGTRRIKMRAAVRQAYSLAVQDGCSCSQPDNNSSRCADDDNISQNVLTQQYTSSELEQAPEEAKEIYFGCGNPIAMAGLLPGEVVLDIGSGGGLDSFIAARKVAPQGKVIGVDMTPAMLQRARASAKRAGIDNVEFRQGHAEKLPLDDSSVDVIISNCVINLVEDKSQVFSEAFRVLKPGGRIEISDIVTSVPLPLQARLDAASWAKCVSGALCEQEYLDLLAQAGFKEIKVRRSPMQEISAYSLVVSAIK